MMNNIIKCRHCGKIFFNIESEYCPFCGENLNSKTRHASKDDLNFLKNIFGVNK